MKKIVYIAFIAFIFSNVFWSCGEEFLEQERPLVSTEDVVFKSATKTEAALLGLYSTLKGTNCNYLGGRTYIAFDNRGEDIRNIDPNGVTLANTYAMAVLSSNEENSDAWYYGYLAGIRNNPEAPGFKKITIAPMPAGDLTSVKASTETLYGVVSSEWEKSDDHFVLKVSIPANTTAEVSVPATENSVITESGKEVAKAGKASANDPNIQFVGLCNGRACFNVLSGSYTFTVK